MTAALSIVSALHAARNRGVGQYIRIPMTEAMMAFTANDATYLGYTFQPDAEFKDKVPKSGSLDPFKTQDGWVTIAPFTDDQWERLCNCLGHAEWWQLENRADRMRAALRGIAKLLPEQTSAHWLKVFEDADIPSGPVHNYDTLFTEPEVIANENFTLYEHPQAGQVRTVNPGDALQRNAGADVADRRRDLANIPRKCCARRASSAISSKNCAPKKSSINARRPVALPSSRVCAFHASMAA